MRRRWMVCVGLVAFTLAPCVAVTSAAAMPAARAGAGVCRHTSYTGDGGYFSQGNFYWQPSDTVTITVKWCSAGGVIISKNVAFTSTIPSTLQPRLTESDVFARGGEALKVNVGGDYESGVLNNVGDIDLVGHVTADGRRHFADLSAAGG